LSSMRVEGLAEMRVVVGEAVVMVVEQRVLAGFAV